MSKLVVLLSCMNSDSSIVTKSNIQTDVIVINQTNKDFVEESYFKNKFNEDCKVLFVNSTTRGLSKSRNLAISLASEWEYGLLSDDDEIFEDDYEDKILNAYSRCSADLIAFMVKRKGKTYLEKQRKMSLSTIIRTSSVQLTFHIQRIIENGLRFDEMMGAGTGNGSGEEVQFMMQCKKKGLSMYYYPIQIATLEDDSSSTWREGYTEKYFQNRGWASRRTFGFFYGTAFIIYNVIHNRKKFKKDGLSLSAILNNCFIGIFSKR